MPTSHPLTGLRDPESLVTCPYNPAHRVAAKRIQFHVTKCRKGHPDVKKECPYNATHMINEQEYQFHLEMCPDKGVLDTFVYATPNENTHVIELPPDPVVPPNEENWDDEYCGTYDPAVKTTEAPIIHGLIGGTPSERKKCKVQQRQKFRALDDSASSTTVAPELVKEKKPAPSGAQPLRRPNTIPSTLGYNSSQLASLNQSFVSVTSDASLSTSKKKGKHVALESECEDDVIPNLVPANAWAGDGSGRSGGSRDDGFILIRSKGRGKLK